MLNWFRSKPSGPESHREDSPELDSSGKPIYRGLAPKERWDQIEFAFTSGGINYFRFNSEVNIPFQRAVAARDIMTEELWQINPEQLKAWVAGLIQVLTDEKKKHDSIDSLGGCLIHDDQPILRKMEEPVFVNKKPIFGFKPDGNGGIAMV